jgi:hypothetical protein
MMVDFVVRNSKHQAPNDKQTTSTKRQNEQTTGGSVRDVPRLSFIAL